MAAKLSPSVRKFSTFKVLRASMADPLSPAAAAGAHEEEHWKMWRNIFWFVCVPAMGLGFLNSALAEEKPRPEFKKYSHLRIRKSTFPWRDGVKTLFHNPHTNALPDGYEDEH